MKVPHIIAATLGIAASAAAFGALAHEDPAGALAQAQIGLTQAVAAAEQHAHGRAVRAELESGNGAPVYGVEVFDGAQSVDVKVDARDGHIVSAQPDAPDVADSGEHEGEGRD